MHNFDLQVAFEEESAHHCEFSTTPALNSSVGKSVCRHTSLTLILIFSPFDSCYDSYIYNTKSKGTPPSTCLYCFLTPFDPNHWCQTELRVRIQPWWISLHLVPSSQVGCMYGSSFSFSVTWSSHSTKTSSCWDNCVHYQTESWSVYTKFFLWYMLLSKGKFLMVFLWHERHNKMTHLWWNWLWFDEPKGFQRSHHRKEHVVLQLKLEIQTKN